MAQTKSNTVTVMRRSARLEKEYGHDKATCRCGCCNANHNKTSGYQPQDSESHCHNLDPDNANALGMKRKRAAQLHEKRCRHKINKRLQALKHLIPNCTKMDTASVLDDAIQYLQSLQYQLRIMSIFAGLPTQMMLPTYYPPTLQCFTSPFLGYGTWLQTVPSMMSLLTRSVQ